MHDPISIDQMSLVHAINRELSRQWPDIPFCPSIYNAAIKAANLVVEETDRIKKLAEHYLASRGVKVPEKTESLNDADVELLREVI
ncbi:hypothetical protein FG475_14970 [Vibrio navarrensis]|uniref:hypothetical protein n=1 Tax=Vibrio navarrensis TaxID=29495 RepID=UPI0018DE869B|nr:hypothetical protein [Vibrio navarrensis]EHA1126422.1 hypothetical protein [Vibrio navarrensis]MBH9739992.1 hypothetical protein [Vibrio navarrensis]HDY8121332.1 hypothetical protein [Vibrio vulnificus]